MPVTAAVMQESLNKEHYTAFLAYVEKTGVEANPESMEKWDKEHNHSALAKEIENKYGKEAIYRIGIREIMRRYLYSSEVLKFRPNPSLPSGLKKSGVPRTSAIRGGIYLPKSTPEQRDVLVEELKAKIANTYARAKFLGLSNEQFIELCEQVLE